MNDKNKDINIEETQLKDEDNPGLMFMREFNKNASPNDKYLKDLIEKFNKLSKKDQKVIRFALLGKVN